MSNAPALEADLALRTLLPRVTACSTKAEALGVASDALRALHPDSTLLYVERGAKGALNPPALLFHELSQDVAPRDLARLLTWCDGACAAGYPQWRRFASAPEVRGVAAPVFFRGAAPDVLCWLVRDVVTPTEQLELALLHGAAHVTLWQVARHSPSAVSAAGVDLAKGLAAAQAASTLEAALRQLALALAESLSCGRVALGLVGANSACRLAAVSDHTKLNRRTELADAIEQSLDEALDIQRVVAWPAEEGAAPQNLRRAATLSGAESAAAAPLLGPEGKPVAAIALFNLPADAAGQQALARLQPSLPALGAVVALLEAAHRSLPSRILGRLRRLRPYRLGIAAAVAALTGAALLAPVPYRINCPGVLEPVTRRYVAAPFAGRLQASLVQSGDLVQAGQPLAQMDASEIALELATLDAELQQARKRCDAALAARNAAAAQVAQLEARQLELRIETLQGRRKLLAIASPLDGVVVRGDLKRSEGAPLTVGQPLFEIAPLDAMIVEVAIPEEQAAHFGPGCQVDLVFDAFGGRVWKGALERIHPRAELRDDRQVFIAEVRLPNPDGALRPGMRGEARVTGPSRKLGWIWLHRPWEELRRLCRG